MTKRKNLCTKWTLVLLVVLCPYVLSRPQETVSQTSESISEHVDKPTEIPTRLAGSSTSKNNEKLETPTTVSSTPESSRDVKTKTPVIRDSIKMVASQLLDKPSNSSVDAPIVPDTRIPPKLKNQLANKHKIKTRNEDGNEPAENSHAGIAVPLTMEELESENKISESSTSNEGISTWILLSNSPNVTTASTEPTKVDENQKKVKPSTQKNKNKRPQNNKTQSAKRPIIGSTNKADLIASGSAINENVYNKIKDTVLSNVQKNKNPTTRTTSTTTTTTLAPTTEEISTKAEVTTKAPSVLIPVVKVTSKPMKKKNKNKVKSTTTQAPVEQEVQESALLPMEPKEHEIELEISTPATTTKKPKRSSTKKKNKTKTRKTSKPKPETSTAVAEIKTSTNKTKSNKTSKKPTSPQSGPLTTQIYNYFSREVMPSVGVGVIGLASLVGLASYFLYPFSTPVRRTFDVDKKDDLYRNNAEEYANDGNGQAEEEMLGTVLAGMPAHSKQKLNPYAGQTQINRYSPKKEQDNIRYRHVTAGYEPNYNVHYSQQKTGIAHGAVYSQPINYGPQQYETRNAYTTESKYVYEKAPTSYTPYPAVEPIYAAPQTGPSAASVYGNDASNSVVYGVKPSMDSNFRPVYPFEGKIISETTSSPVVDYQPTSMYLGSNNDEEPEDNIYEDVSELNTDHVDNKFVVGNVPKELVESATPAVVPEHGPRQLRKKRSTVNRKRSITGTIEEMLKEANKDVFLSNEIDEVPVMPIKNILTSTESAALNVDITSTPNNKEVFTVYATSVDPMKEENSETTKDTLKDMVVESVSTIPVSDNKEKVTTDTDMSNELDTTTKSFRVYEVFTNSPNDKEKAETTTQAKNMMTETTTESRSETTSTMPPSPSPTSETKLPPSTIWFRPRPTMNPEVITYPPLNQDGGFFSFLKRLVEFKYRLGLSILQTTSDNLNRYLRSMEDSMQKAAKASQ